MHFRPVARKERDLSQEKLLSPKELGALVGLSTAQVRALMNNGRLEFVEITPKTRLLTMTGWERFQRQATKVRELESERIGAVQGAN
jgi:hypothetical protein